MANVISGFTVNETPIHTGPYTVIHSAIRDSAQVNVVIKSIRTNHPSQESILRLKHEYEIAKRFESDDDVVNVYSFEKNENNYAIIMENILTPTLTEVLEKNNKLALTDFFLLAIAIVKALTHIHDKFIIHKDINPSNIMCDELNKKVKIIDFSLAADIPKAHVELVSANMLEGAMSYVSPEQTGRMNRSVDYRTDFYSLGVIYYQMLTGVLPFPSKDPIELLHCHMALIPKSPYEVEHSIPKIVSDIVMKLLSKNAEDRYKNAHGLLADLQRCHDEWTSKGKIQNFLLAQKDIFSRFQISEKLYGRELQVETLLDTYEQVMQGGAEFMLVSGYSGIGKSSLVHEIHKPIAKRHGYFISGKYDQFKHNIPYSAIGYAFDELIKIILREPEDVLINFREQIQKAVGDNGQVIVDVIPSLVSLIGEQQPVPVLDPVENLNRFIYIFQKLISVLSTAEHPLVLFLDDLQWMDLPSLKMIETLLTTIDVSYLFIIGAYRSNEVDVAHPLMLLVNELESRQVVCQSIYLGPLALHHVTDLLAETFHRNRSSVQNLAVICYEKTNGNPFFLIQLLMALVKDELIEFDSKKNKWIWHLDHIKEKKISDNVVDLLAEQMQRISLDIQKTLQYAACIGSHFDIDLLSQISGKKLEAVFWDLKEAQKKGYILGHGNAHQTINYEFIHDGIQQAAYSMLGEKEAQLIHINLARILLKNTSPHQLDEHIFKIVDHYNTGLAFQLSCVDKAELRNIAVLNLKASKMAKAAAAFSSALRYVECGLKCLNKKTWDDEYQLMFNLYAEATEAAYLSARYDLQEQYAEIALIKAQNIFDEIKIIQIKIHSAVSQMKQKEALDLAVSAILRLGVTVYKKPTKLHVLISVVRVKYFMLGKDIANLINLPEMNDKSKKTAMDLLSSVIAAAYQVDPYMMLIFICLGVELSLRYGNCKGSPFPYVAYGMLLCVLGDIEHGYQFGELALNLVDKIHDEKSRTRVIFTKHYFINHWKNPLEDSIPRLVENFESGLNKGNFESATYSITVACLGRFFCGDSLKKLLPNVELYKLRVQKFDATNFTYISMIHCVLLNFMRKNENPHVLSGKGFDEYEISLAYINSSNKTGLMMITLYKLLLSFHFENQLEVMMQIKNGDKYSNALNSAFPYQVFKFYKALGLLREYSLGESKNKHGILKTVTKILKQMAVGSQSSPSNYSHKYMLVKAEWMWRVNKKIEQAARLYEQAITTAKSNDFVNEEALANELAAKFYMSLGNEKIARVYMEEACFCYRQWGADAKVSFLNEHYPQLLILDTFKSRLRLKDNYTEFSLDEGVGDISLDLSTFQKSAQALSESLILEDLLKKLMQILMENAGAQKCYLLLFKDNKLVIEAEANVNHSNINVLQAIQLTDELLPTTIINYVSRSKEPVVLDKATKSLQFMQDPYIVNFQPKSILCMPLLNQSVLSGIVYMENNLNEGVFTKDRIYILNLLSSQMAISIDNARLYNETKELNAKLSALVQSYERFVPKEFLSILERKSIQDVYLGDHVQKNMTVLFADIRNFTQRSDKLTPQESTDFINSFLKIMAPIIKKNHGFVDKYIGDSIMALFPESSDDALKSSIEMQSALKEYNKQNPGQVLVTAGIGINTGSLMICTVGEANRMNVTVISDAVNIASRVEALTKTYNLPILITEMTYRSLKNPATYPLKEVELVQLKGKEQKIMVYQVQL